MLFVYFASSSQSSGLAGVHNGHFKWEWDQNHETLGTCQGSDLGAVCEEANDVFLVWISRRLDTSCLLRLDARM